MQQLRIWRGSLPYPIAWLAVVVVANGLDILTTAIGLRLGIPEGNPLMASTLRLDGELAMYSLKILLVAAMFLLVAHAQRRYRTVWPLFAVMALPPVLVVVNNLAWIAHALS